ncbi:MAG: response regulator [Acidimicrobiia bacterium]|nr:response regulator [Acidimicrobiia bacterium]
MTDEVSAAPRQLDPATDCPPAVLFVDDENEVLNGLRGALRRLRNTYSFHFACGAEEALAILDRAAIDVVVTDMRMPGMNGVELLAQIKTRHPGVVRYVLSGEAQQELVVRAVPVAHRWLTKPCDREDLTAALGEAVRFRALLADPALKRAVSSTGTLPSPPRLYGELLELLSNGEVPVADVADLVGTDPAISAKLLQWANSAFSGGQRCDDLRTAVVRIGFSTISQMVLVAGVFRQLEPREAIPGFDADLLGHHAGLISTIAGELARPGESSSARLGGLFSEVGLLLEATCLPDRLGEAYELATRADITLVEAERQRFGLAYPDLGGHLLSVWGLPTGVALAAAEAHEQPCQLDRSHLPAPDAVRAARLVAQRLPHSKRIGRAHLDRPDDELKTAVDGWTQTVISSGSGHE